MEKTDADIGVVGLGVMGRNLAYNIADHGFGVVGYDRDDAKVDAMTDDAGTDSVSGAHSLTEMMAVLKKPRAVLLLVPAGKPVDAVIGELKAHLDAGDIIIDGGNSHFTDTNRHADELAADGIHFLGVGVSGGSEGARNGPSMMPGGPKEAYDRVKGIFEAIAAKVDGDSCVTYLGPGSAGHYVKMVHNGIEYAIMELIAEAYDLLRRLTQMSNDDIADVFEEWNKGLLASFLVDITSTILRVRDTETTQHLIDMILDAARQKGTGKWTSQDAMELQVPVPTIDAAVSMRDMSGYKQEREDAAKVFPPADINNAPGRKELIVQLEGALHFAIVAAYAQGFSLLRAASEKYNYHLNAADIARIWRGGCIIRAGMLDNMRRAFGSKRDLPNLIISKPFAGVLRENRRVLSKLVGLATEHGVPVAGLSSALAYYDAYRTFQLPANLIQAQRDFFGSHTYERIDRKGTFHTEWKKPVKEMI